MIRDKTCVSISTLELTCLHTTGNVACEMEELSPAMRLVEELRALQEWRRSNERPDGEEEELSPAMRLVEQLRALQAREEAAAPAPTPCRLNRKKRERSATGFRGKTTIPQWSPWSAAGGWSLAGLPWHECGRGNAFTPQIDRVRAVLTRDTWAWDMDFDAAAPAAPGWFHITPTSVTEAQAKLLVNRAGTYSNMDYYALLRNLDERRPESVHPREPCIWVSHVVYFWNISRGWCSAARCGEKFTDRGMIFTGEQGLNVGGTTPTRSALSADTTMDYINGGTSWAAFTLVARTSRTLTPPTPTPPAGFQTQMILRFPTWMLTRQGVPPGTGWTSTAELPGRRFQRPR